MAALSRLNIGRAANAFGLLIALAVIFAGFGLLMPKTFPTWENAEVILRQAAIVCLAALGMTFIIISAAIDLSVGSVVAFCTVVIAYALDRLHWLPWQAATLGIASGLLCGVLNGTLITKLKVSPFIVTLGSYLIFRGIAKGLADNQKIDAPMTWLRELLAKPAKGHEWILVSYGVWLTLVCAILAAAILRMTVFGRHAIAVGGNEKAARYSGIRVDRVKVGVFALAGFFTGLAGLMQFSRLTVGDPTVAQGLELDVIAAVVIGGASLSGGEGSILGAVLGAIIMATIRSGCSQYGLPNWVQEIVTGAIIVLAVALDRIRLKSRTAS